jgi:hypothetical protein
VIGSVDPVAILNWKLLDVQEFMEPLSQYEAVRELEAHEEDMVYEAVPYKLAVIAVAEIEPETVKLPVIWF